MASYRDIFSCPNCDFKRLTFKDIVRHIRLMHRGSQITCTFDNCCNIYMKLDSYVKHVKRSHNKYIDFNVAASRDIDTESSDNGQQLDFIDESTIDNELVLPSKCITVEELINSMTKEVTLFMLRLREVHILPSTVQVDIVNELKSLFVYYTDCLNELLQSQLQGKKENPLIELTANSSMFDVVFENVVSQDSLLRYLKGSNLIVLPRRCYIETGDKSTEYSYVPVKDVLEKLLDKETIYENLSQPRHNKTYLCSFQDGEIFQQDEYFQQNPNAIMIHLYIDEFELCNPIGSKRGKHKVMAVYYTLGNLHLKFRSQLHMVHLAILIRYQLVKKYKYNYELILQPLLFDLKLLHLHGMTLNVYNNDVRIKAKVCAIHGDNLAVHYIAGFQRYFNGGRICRFCMATYDNMSLYFSETNFCLRSPELHAYHLAAIEANETNTMYGVVGPCAFNKLPNFDIMKLFPPDIMHDIMEGVIPKVVQLVLHTLVRDSLITCDELNTNIQAADLPNTKNRPNLLTNAALKKGGHIVGTAAQKLELMYLLPQLVSESVEQENPVWQVYLKLRLFCDYIFAPIVSIIDLSYIDVIAAEFLQHYVNAFGRENMTPKFHYIIHYARTMRLFGPLRPLWCMRYEGKHQYFKSVINSLKNFKNVSRMLSIRHQMRQSWELFATNPLESALTARQCQGSKPIIFRMMPNALRERFFSKLSISVELSEPIKSVESLLFNHIEFIPGRYYVIRLEEEENIPIFGCVKFIIFIRQSWFLCCKVYKPDYFYKHVHAYKVNVDGWDILCPTEVLDYSAHNSFILDDLHFISLRYNLENPNKI